VEQLSEWRIAMQALREKGIRVGSACFPYGAFNDATLSTLAATAIPVGLMLGKRSVEPSDRIIALPRVIVAFSDSLPKLLYKINIRPKLRFGKR
jgi:hypothetical protein